MTVDDPVLAGLAATILTGWISGPGRPGPAVVGGLAPSHGLHRILHGTARLQAPEGLITARAGDLLLSRPGEPVTAAPTARVAVLRFTLLPHALRRLRGTATQAIEIADTRPEKPLDDLLAHAPPRLLSGPLPAAWLALLTTLQDSWWRGPQRHLWANAALTQWLLERCGDSLGPRPPRAEQDPLVAAELHAAAHLHRRLGIADLARAAGLGRSSFCARWRAERAGTPMAMLRRLRLEQAQRLLRDEGRTVAATARHCGLRDANALIRIFRAELGCTPDVWRRRLLSG